MKASIFGGGSGSTLLGQLLGQLKEAVELKEGNVIENAEFDTLKTMIIRDMQTTS